MIKITTQQSYNVKASKEIKRELDEKTTEKVRFFLWYISEEAKHQHGIKLEILANISESGTVSMFFTDKNTGAMFDTVGFPLALSLTPIFKRNEMGEIIKIETIQVRPRDVENWEQYFKTFDDVKSRASFLPKARGGR